MGTTVQLRPRTARVLGVVMMALAAAGLVSAALGGASVLLDYVAPLLLVAVLSWAAFWRPCVEISDGEVLVVNTFRSVHVPWPAIEDVEGRYGLRLRTAYGSVTAWAAGAPAGRQRARGQESDAAALVTERLESLRSAGYLDDRRLELPTLRKAWHHEVIGAVAVLLVASAVLPMLG